MPVSFFWMKLYHDRLNDPRFQALSDRLWRRAVELELVASLTRRETHLGRLPRVEEIAFHLRLQAEEVEADLVELSRPPLRLTELVNGHWFLRNFAERQVATSSSARGVLRREREQRKAYAASLPEESPPTRREAWHVSLANELPDGPGAYRIVCSASHHQHIGASRQVRRRVKDQLRDIKTSAAHHPLGQDYIDHGPASFFVEFLRPPFESESMVELERAGIEAWEAEGAILGEATPKSHRTWDLRTRTARDVRIEESEEDNHASPD